MDDTRTLDTLVTFLIKERDRLTVEPNSENYDYQRGYREGQNHGIRLALAHIAGSYGIMGNGTVDRFVNWWKATHPEHFPNPTPLTYTDWTSGEPVERTWCAECEGRHSTDNCPERDDPSMSPTIQRAMEGDR